MNAGFPPVACAIGDPGRAAAEMPDGPPPDVAGPSDIELSAATLPGMRIRAASSRGLQHRAQRTLRQDAFALSQAPGGGAVAVVCDGVGSLDRSDWAALLVSRRLAEHGAAGIPWPDAFAAANNELAKAAAESEASAGGGMATTALAVSVSWSAGIWSGQVAWVGDSPLWHLRDDGRWQPVTPAAADGDSEDFHSSGVRAMPSPDGGCAWCSFRIRGGALFAMTDGVGNPLAWSTEVRAALAHWWGRPPDPLTFAGQVGFARRSHVDDRTVVGIWADGE
jgi:hypothetical protein